MRTHLFISTSVAALVLLGAASTANAADTPAPVERSLVDTTTSCPPTIGHCLPFDRGNATPHALAEKMRASFAKTHSYDAVIDPERCATDGSCGTIRSWWDSYHVKALDLKLEDTADYIDHFHKKTLTAEDRDTVWDMDCLQADGGGYKVIISCMYRKLKPGEEIWINGENAMAKDCNNPIRGKHHEPEEIVVKDEEPCVQIEFPTQNVDGKDTGVNIPVLGNVPFPASTCWGIKWAGTTVIDRTLPDHCPENLCDEQGLANAAHRTIQKKISEIPATFGTNILYGPAVLAKSDVYTVVFCWTKITIDGLKVHSRAIGMRSVHFVHRADGVVIATIKQSDVVYP